MIFYLHMMQYSHAVNQIVLFLAFDLVGIDEKLSVFYFKFYFVEQGKSQFAKNDKSLIFKF